MPDESITLHLTAVLNLTPAQFAAMLLRAEAEKHPAIVTALQAQANYPSQYETVLATSAPQPPPEPPAEPVQAPPEPPPAEEPPAPQPPAARRGRPPRANGEAKAVEPEPPAPEPDKPLEESEVRAVLRLYSTIVPGRDTAVVKLLEEVGGAPRLADCDRETWPAIVAAAKQGIAANAQAAD